MLVNGSIVQVFSDSYDRFDKDQLKNRYLYCVVERGTVDGLGNYFADCFAPNYLEPFTPTLGTKAGTEVNITRIGNRTACKKKIDAILQLDDFCSFPPCGLIGRYVPKMNNHIGYVLKSSFFYAAEDLG